jgi:hypothetical protein
MRASVTLADSAVIKPDSAGTGTSIVMRRSPLLNRTPRTAGVLRAGCDVPGKTDRRVGCRVPGGGADRADRAAWAAMFPVDRPAWAGNVAGDRARVATSRGAGPGMR